MKNKVLFIVIIIFMFIQSCSTGQVKINKIIEQYYSVYQERNDFSRFMEYYDESVNLEDIITGERVSGKENLRNFFAWENPNYKNLNKKSLVIEEQVIENNKVITKGYFTNFKWGETEYEAMYFTTILIFNQEGKITKQIDWINYPNSLVDYSSRKNANKWILE